MSIIRQKHLNCVGELFSQEICDNFAKILDQDISDIRDVLRAVTLMRYKGRLWTLPVLIVVVVLKHQIVRIFPSHFSISLMGFSSVSAQPPHVGSFITMSLVVLHHDTGEKIVELVSGYGEIWSAQILTQVFKDTGKDFYYINARKVLFVNEDASTGPEIMWELSREKLLALMAVSQTKGWMVVSVLPVVT